MRTFSLLKGMPAVDHTGEQLGIVCDLCIAEDGSVTDFLLQAPGLLGKKYRLSVRNVAAFGKQHILLHDKNDLARYREQESEHTMTHSQPLAKKYAISQHGEQLGLLDDVYFLEETGTIVGYELTDGFFSDISQGKRVIRTPHPPRIGKDAIIVSVNKLRGGEAHDEVSELPEQGSWENWN
ncbi:MAG TPA: PRC-barrel domain-containing protein [Bacillaceae bacterium]